MEYQIKIICSCRQQESSCNNRLSLRMDKISNLCFPYAQSREKVVTLDQLVFSDENEDNRVSVRVEDGESNSIIHMAKIDCDEQRKPLKFVQNTLSGSTKPLLLAIPNSLRHLKLQLIVGEDKGLEDKKLVVVKKYAAKYDVSEDIDQMNKLGVENSLLDTSTFDLNKLIEKNSTKSDRLTIEDVLENSILSDDVLNISLFLEDQDGNNQAFVLGCSVWIEESTEEMPKSSAEVVDYSEEIPDKSMKISDFQKAFGFNIEDGPEFRGLLQRYETNIPLLKKTLTAFAEETKNLDVYSRRLIQIQSKIAKHIKTISDLQFNNLLKQFGFPKQFERQFSSMFQHFYTNVRFFIRNICDEKILAKILSIFNSNINIENNPINELQVKKRHFESVSKEYYHWLNKYLSKEKERPESKFLSKRKAFELGKFDYLNHFNMLTNNQYYNQFLEKLFKFVGLRYSDESPGLLDFKVYDDVKQSQSLLNKNYKIYLNVLLRYNGEKYQFRQMIEACQTNDELSSLIKFNPLNNASIQHEDPISDDQSISNENLDLVFDSNKPSTAKGEIFVEDDQISEMSGILYKLGGQKKQGWHKQWVVLKNGQLFEYSDWREAKSPMGRPIEIALSSIRPTVHEKRHNCVEILTSAGEKHIFQTMDENDLNKWMKALFNAGQMVDRSRLEENLGTLTKSKLSKSETSEKRKPPRRLNTDLPTKPPTISDRSVGRSNSPISISSKLRLQDKDFLGLVRKIEGSDNHLCADCGSAETVEWISVNFLVCFCIKCSSSHRSLGSHISKIKSLKLDNFADETELLLHYINNSNVNTYMEAKVKESEKITADASNEQRLEYIKNKYVLKSYCSSYPDANTLLIRAVQNIQIHDVLKYIVCGGDVDVNIQISNKETQESVIIALFEYSLKKFIEIEDENSEKKKLFAISELLILNGCKVDYNKDAGNGLALSDEAMKYWNLKRMKLAGTLVSP